MSSVPNITEGLLGVPENDTIQSSGSVSDIEDDLKPVTILPKTASSYTRPLPNGGTNSQVILSAPAQLTTLQGCRVIQRHIFLYPDLVLVGTETSTVTSPDASFHRLCDVWVKDCPPDMHSELVDLGMEADSTLLLGWPLVNLAVTFRDKREKQQWLLTLLRFTAKRPQRLNSGLHSRQMHIYNRAFSSGNTKTAEVVNISPSETIDSVLPRVLEACSIVMGDPSQFRLGVLVGGKDNVFLLLGHENPHAITVAMAKKQNHTDLALDDSNKATTSNPHFVLLDCEKSTYFHPDELMHLVKKKKFPSMSSKMASKLRRMSTRRKGSATISKRKPKTKLKALFSQPLNDIMGDDLMPVELEALMVKIYIEGPDVIGILRKSPNAKVVREFREAMDAGQADVSTLNVVNAGGVLKEFLRSIPGCLMCAPLYQDWATTVLIEDKDERDLQVRGVLDTLPTCHKVLLHNFMAVLGRISENSDVNQMTAANLSICVGPSLLWPSDGAADALKNEIQMVVQYMVENYSSIFGPEPPLVIVASQMDDTAFVLNHLSLSVETLDRSSQLGTSDSSTSPINSEDDASFRDRSRAISCFNLVVDDEEGEGIQEVDESKRSASANELSH